MESSKKGKRFWGRAFWKSIRCAAVAYRPENYVHFKTFMYSLTYLLPCDECREHLAMNLENIPMEPYSASNEDMFFWTYILQDTVNRQINEKNGYVQGSEDYHSSPEYRVVKRKYFSALVDEDCKSCGNY